MFCYNDTDAGDEDEESESDAESESDTADAAAATGAVDGTAAVAVGASSVFISIAAGGVDPDRAGVLGTIVAMVMLLGSVTTPTP